ncbi:type II secretion system minor pseudopilin GspH [Candidatus Venteria ishoeyi]|uniref:Type II secretion system protein H n=1 Tax=Candidatus Venteria ishoeyi TaxID=1899563 RepID=A0A1H6F6A9_9GAMM|nr:type II secretion system minor pseudopilin GspH [Candidatus Venteria ishoeyi]SEH04626.1 Type II transport protein GspH [Candidatus Venteria ishoeyi]
MLLRQRQVAGFTLLEVLVVMVLIGVILGLAALSTNLGGHQKILETEAKRLQQLLQLATEEAILNSRTLGVQFKTNGYRFLRLEDQTWQAVDGTTSTGDNVGNIKQVFRPRQLPEGFELQIEIEGVYTELDSYTQTGVDEMPMDEGGNLPQILLLPDGETTPFICILQTVDQQQNDSYRLELGQYGRPRIEHRNKTQW